MSTTPGFVDIRARDRSRDDGGRLTDPAQPRALIVVSRADVLLAAGVPVGIPYDDQEHLRQLAARDREVRRGRAIAIALVLIAALVWFTLIGGPDILLGR